MVAPGRTASSQSHRESGHVGSTQLLRTIKRWPMRRSRSWVGTNFAPGLNGVYEICTVPSINSVLRLLGDEVGLLPAWPLRKVSICFDGGSVPCDHRSVLAGGLAASAAPLARRTSIQIGDRCILSRCGPGREGSTTAAAAPHWPNTLDRSPLLENPATLALNSAAHGTFPTSSHATARLPGAALAAARQVVRLMQTDRLPQSDG